MAWNVPSVFVAEQPVTAAELNLFVRDNLLETAPAKATAAGQLLVTSGPNSVAMRRPASAYIGDAVYTSSTTPVLLTGGPEQTFTHGGAFILLFSARMRASSGPVGPNDLIQCGPEIVGFAPASVSRSIRHTTNAICRWSGHVLANGVPPGETTVRMRYWVNNASITGEFLTRDITVIPF